MSDSINSAPAPADETVVVAAPAPVAQEQVVVAAPVAQETAPAPADETVVVAAPAPAPTETVAPADPVPAPVVQETAPAPTETVAPADPVPAPVAQETTSAETVEPTQDPVVQEEPAPAETAAVDDGSTDVVPSYEDKQVSGMFSSHNTNAEIISEMEHEISLLLQTIESLRKIISIKNNEKINRPIL